MMRQTKRTTNTGMAIAALLGLASTGCSICPSPYDMDYSAFGTATPRADMRCGRVGSIFSDPNASGSMVAPSETIVEPDAEVVAPASHSQAVHQHPSHSRAARRANSAPLRKASAWQSPESAELYREASNRGEVIVGEVTIEDVVIESTELEAAEIDGVEIGDIGPQ